ncbi:MAG: Nif3-like dinuclear metal center hexameric protein [Bacillota bacterium]
MLNTQQIFDIALRAAGLTEAPADSGIIVPGKNIRKIAFGVDIDTSEILLAKELGIDCVITHHPHSKHKVDLYKVMDNQIDRMVEAGVPINKAQKALAERKEQVDRSMHVSNYDKAANAAKLLDMPFISLHSPADLLVEDYLQQYLDDRLANQPQATIKDIIDLLLEIPEYSNSYAKPKVRVGSESSYAGRVFVTMAGGTSGGKDVVKAYFEAGIGTLVLMHVPDDIVKAVKEQNIGNIIVAGHMASDSIGINLLIKAIEEKGVEVFRMSGVIEP